MSSPTRPHENDELDPVFRHSRREAVVIFCIWLAAMLWSVTFCYLDGYPEEFDAARFRTVWGIPSWLFWGIALPWIIADLVTTWFCFCYMKDDDLGEAREGADLQEQAAELRGEQFATESER